MPGLVPGIHVLFAVSSGDVDKPGHDNADQSIVMAVAISCCPSIKLIRWPSPTRLPTTAGTSGSAENSN
jgi:hypothetical protein